jgi:hypothetical protein
MPFINFSLGKTFCHWQPQKGARVSKIWRVMGMMCTLSACFLHRFLKFSTCGIAPFRTHPAMAGGLLHESETSIFLFSPDSYSFQNFGGDVSCCKLWVLHRWPNWFHVLWDSFFSEMVCISMEGRMKPYFKVSVLFRIGLFCVFYAYFFLFHLTQSGYCS